MVSRTFSLLFTIRKQKDSLKKTSDSEIKKSPIYIRVTVDGRRTELSAKRDVDPKIWNKFAGRAKGTKEEIKALNAYLDVLQFQLQENIDTTDIHYRKQNQQSNKPAT